MERVIKMLTHKVNSVMRGHAVWLKQSQNTEFSCFKEYWNIYGASPPLFPIGSVSLKFLVFFGTAIMHFGFEAEIFFYWKSIYSLVTSNTLVIDSRCQANKHLERGGWKDKHALSKYYFKNIQSIPDKTPLWIYTNFCSLLFKINISFIHFFPCGLLIMWYNFFVKI